MKLKNYFLSMLAIGALVSCSSDDIADKPSNKPDAFLSLAINPEYKLSAKAGVTVLTEDKDDKITSLTVAVFNNGAYEGVDLGKLVAIQTSDLTNAEKDTVENIPVQSGQLQIIAVANRDVESKVTLNSTTLAQFLALTADLVDEAPDNLAMSSPLLNVTTIPGANFCGYKATEKPGYHDATPTSPFASDEGIQVHRLASRVQLTKLSISNKTTEWGTPVRFKLDSIFIANAKRYSNIASTAGWGVVESATNGWYDGAEVAELGSLKKHTNGVEVAWLCEPYSHPAVGAGKDAPLIQSFFYVYENNQSTATLGNDKTLLLIRGDFTYIPFGGTEEVTKYDCYYAVTVNRPNADKSFDGVAEHNYIKRNVKYNIQVTLQGPGSKEPFDPEAEAHIAAKVQVLDWNVVEIDEPNLD